MSSSDDALLARLNALRTSSAPLSISKSIQTPESTLSSRLKALRTASEPSTTSSPRPFSPSPTRAPISPKGQGPRLSLSSPRHGYAPVSAPTTGDVKAVFDDASRQAGELREEIGRTKLFERNADEDLKLAREATEAANAAGHEIKSKWGDEAIITKSDDTVKRLRGDVAAALERAKRTFAAKDGGALVADEDNKPFDTSYEDQGKQKVQEDDIDSDDENGSKRDEDEEADALLAELMDDVALGFKKDLRRDLHQQEKIPGSPPQIRPPPSLITPVPPASSETKELGGDDEENRGKDDEEEDDFHRAMALRMSALQSPSPERSSFSLPSAPSSQPVDSLGLPSAPVDRLSKIAVSTQAKEDYVCKICYDKATVFCEGCEEEFEEWDTKDDAMYCARCWKEVHLGETADEEERQHQWVTVKRGK